jgi:thioredoxin reductase (NADPH)
MRIDAIYPTGESFQLLVKGEVITAKSVILASGLSSPHYLPGEEKLVGKGVGYCATCDAPLYKGKKVIVLGETEEARDDANFLTEVCGKVIYISQHGNPDKLKENVEVVLEKPKAIHGEQRFESIETEKGKYEADGVFIIREVTPLKEILAGLEMEKSYIKVNHDLSTNIPGVFAAGDVTGPPYQIAKAVGEGATAALNAVKYLDSLK